MKVIISHDVDHLYGSDHLKDLVYPKLWVRETLAMLRGRIAPGEWRGRMLSPFHKKRNYIDEVMSFDAAHGVPSTFFFGMGKGLGMSYDSEKATDVIKSVKDNGFCAGVHGIAYDDKQLMQKEFDRFENLNGCVPEGIRMHYVRFDDKTFERLSECGYRFDSTKFNKTEGTCLEAPYKVKNMWEFPLTIMDGYLPYPFEKAKERSLELIEASKEKNLGYITVLFHDCFFCSGWAETEKWYRWIIEYFESSPEFQFISFRDAVKELENNDG